jgi:HlyD family secretion protein
MDVVKPWRREVTPRRGVSAAVLVAALAAALLASGCGRKTSVLKEIPTETVQRQDVVVTVEATGTVEPINVVEVKSKASGQIIRMPVEIGSAVKAGDLLVQIDTQDVQNQYDQARAALTAAEARAQVSAAQRKRSDQLLGQQVITDQEHEAAVLENANAQAALVTARTNLELARQRRADATVRAPIAGTVLAKPVSVGQVISSATSSVSGGTVLLQMADLNRVRVRALVSETDIGRVRPGQSATVTVDAYPQRPFQGQVEKIEPQAVVEQSVTMFPVLVSLTNEQGLLLPGMNGEVNVLVDQREGVLAVPVDAVRSVREITPLAATLGLDADTLRAQVTRAREAFTARMEGADSAARGGRGWAGAGAKGGRSGAWARGGASGDSARARGWRGRGGGGQSARGAGGSAGGVALDGASSFARTGMAAGAAMSGTAAGTGSGMGRAGPQIVVVKTARGLEPRIVRTGLNNYDYVEILNGLQEGDQVVMLAAVELQQQRTDTQDRIRQRVGGVPGMQSNTGARSGASGGGGRTGGGAGGGGR